MNAHTPPQPQTPERALRCALVGMPGAGKSTVGRQLAQRMGVPFVDLDHHLEKQLGCSIRQFFESEGEERFRTLESEALADIAQRPGGMCSAKTVTPSRNWITGAKYCSTPRTTRGRRIAAAPNSSNGTVVAMPEVISSSELPGSVPKVNWPPAASRDR